MQKKGKSFKRKKYIAMALTLAGLCCYGTVPAWAVYTNLTITDGTEGNGPYYNHVNQNVGGNLTLGDQSGDTGTYNLMPEGSLTVVGKVIVGKAGTGIFNQNAYLDLSSSGGIVLGSSSGGTGTYNLAYGVTLKDDLIVGDAGTGTFNNNGGTHNVSGNLILGNQSSGNGTYTITGDSAQTNVNFISGGNGGAPNGALIIGNGGAGSFTQGSGDQSDSHNQVNVAGDLTLGQQSNSVGTYTLNTGTLKVGGQLAVGGQSQNNNTFTQYGGAVNLTGTASGNTDWIPVMPGFEPWGGTLSIGGGTGNGNGSNAGGTGTYNLIAGSIYSSNNIQVGTNGNGTMNHSGGDVTAYFMTVDGTYNLQGDNSTLHITGAEGVGAWGTGTFHQSGGVHTIDLGYGQISSLNLGGTSAGQGTYNQTGGMLNINQGNLSVGDQGTGTFSQTNADGHSTVNITQNTSAPPPSGQSGDSWSTGNLYIGGSPTVIPDGATGSTGTYIMTDTGSGNQLSLTVAGEIFIGGNNQNGQFGQTQSFPCANASSLCNGSFIQNGGTVTVDHSANPNYGYYADIQIGIVGGSGSYTLNDGTLITPNTIEVGNTSTGNFFNQNGGTVNTGQVWLANAGGSEGTYNLGAGATLNAGVMVGVGGTGVFNNTGGTQNSGDVVIGGFDGSNGTYNLSDDGILNVGDSTSGRLSVGDYGTGKFEMTGGEINIHNGSTSINAFVVGNNTGSVGTFTQSGGVVNGGRSLHIGMQGGTGTYNLNTDLVNGTIPLLNTGFISLGYNGTGVFNQQAGTTNNTGALYIGADHGTYNQFGGDLNVSNTVVGTFGIGEFNQSGGKHTTDALQLGQYSGSSGTYTLTGGDLIVNGQMSVGQAGNDSSSGSNGLFTQSAGTVKAREVVIGGFIDHSDPNQPLNGGTGRYDLSGGSIDVSGGNIVLGELGQGTLNQSGGTVTAGDLTVGKEYGSTGKYALSGDQTVTLDVTGSIVLGVTGRGEFDQSGGQVTTGGLFMGQNGTDPNPTGIYRLTGTGNLQVNSDEIIGQLGHGEFYQGDGLGTTSHTVTGTLTIGDGAIIYHDDINGTHYGDPGYLGNPIDDINSNSRSGSYVLTDGKLSTGSTIVASQGYGTFLQSGGSHQVSGDLIIGQQNLAFERGCGDDCSVGGPAQGTYTFNGGLLTVGGQVIVGDAGNGTFNQNANLDLSTSGGIVLGRSSGGTGTYNLASSVTLKDDLIVGDAGTGTFNNNGGTHNVSGDLVLGSKSTGNGTYNLKPDGNLSVTGTTIVGAKGTGLFEQTGGTNNSKNLIIGNNAGSNGTYNLSGGNLVIAESVTIQAQSGSTGKLDMTGGTLTAASLTNNGTFDYSAGALTLGGGSGTLTNNVGATLNNTGTLSNSGTLKNFGTLNNYGTLNNSGTLNYNGLIDGGGTLLNSGLLTGNSTINGTVQNSGTVNPGNSPGTLSITGNYTQTSAGTFVAELGGTLQGINYDWLNINGTASLNGILDIYLYGGFTPTLNETFTIITTTDRIAGTFSSYMYPNSSSGDWAIIYGMDSVTLQYLVDGGSAPVPEPATMLLLGTSLAGLAGFRMKRKKG